MASTSTPQLEVTREVRFAVVMYGGVSLAIYINGVTQELLRMVRSTAKDATGHRALLYDDVSVAAGQPDNKNADALRGTERVYRKLSYLLSNEKLLEEYRAYRKKPPEEKKPSDAGEPPRNVSTAEELNIRKKLERMLEQNDEPINTRFIVDILSGTSAGGINSVFLAKALANNQHMDKLKQLWITEGDIALLLNDKISVSNTMLDEQQPPQSLLNSHRMYLKLLDALHNMGDDPSPHSQKDGSPHVDELDLYITATDIEGVPLPLQLSDTVVYERRHRNVFHFKYSTEDAVGRYRNDFLRGNNPFLAFAARCTSSFPFAFEPMQLGDIDNVLRVYKEHDYKTTSDPANKKLWQRFFEENIDPRTGDNDNGATGTAAAGIDVTKRSFGDGGYLDNKPFSYATETLTHRHSTVPVDRKLIYIEPSPKHPEDERQRKTRPDAISNCKAALIDLPGYETIREDLQRVLQRNRLISRVNRIIESTSRDIESLKSPPSDEPSADPVPQSEKSWRLMDTAMMIKYHGLCHLPYRKLRVASVTDDLTSLVARIKNLDVNSDAIIALRSLVRAWREESYVENYKNPKKKDLTEEASKGGLPVGANITEETNNAFLEDYDFSYRFRRLNFIRKKIDKLYRLAGQLPKGLGDKEPRREGMTTDQLQTIDILQKKGLDYFVQGVIVNAERVKLREDLMTVLAYLKCELGEVHKTLKVAIGKLQVPQAQACTRHAPGLKNRLISDDLDQEIEKFRQHVDDLKLDKKQLAYLLGMPGDVSFSGEVKSFLKDGQNFAKLDEETSAERAEDLLSKNGKLKGSLQEAARQLKKILVEMVVGPTSAYCRQLLDYRGELPPSINKRCDRLLDLTQIAPRTFRAVRGYLHEFYLQFDDYDQIGFPILYNTDFGESDVVDLIRISPEDATSLINEREERKNCPDGNARHKLAGTALHNFGAFLDPVWRQNDIMWGRLDGAERLITALMPDPLDAAVRAELITEAHHAILIEEMPPENRRELGRLMTDALVRTSSGEDLQKSINKVLHDLEVDSTVQTRLQKVMLNGLENQELLEFIRRGYEVNRKLDPKQMLRALSRSTQIIGKVFEDIANRNNLDSKSLSWIARLGQFFWGMIEVAVPNSILNMLWTHWLKVLYVFEIVAILAGLLLSRPEVQQFGWTAFGITAVFNVMVLVLKDLMRGKHAVFRSTVFLICVCIALLAAVGGLEVAGSVFNLTVGSPPLHPLDWLKEYLRINLPQNGWFATHLRPLASLFVIAVILFVLNAIGAVKSWRPGRR